MHEYKEFIPKELRQIEHFLQRELGDDVYWDYVTDCSCGACARTDEYIDVGDALRDSEIYNKFIVMAKKYDLCVKVERYAGKIWSSTKGYNSGTIQSI